MERGGLIWLFDKSSVLLNFLMKLIIGLVSIVVGIRVQDDPGSQFIDGKPYTRKIPDHFSPGSIYE